MDIPNFLRELLENQYGEELSKRIIQGYGKRKTTLRVNTIKSNKEEVEKNLKLANIEFEEVGWNENALIIKAFKPEEKSIENPNGANLKVFDINEKIRSLKIYQDGKIYLQSLSSMLPPIVLEPNKNENILDMAAAPGGKTTEIAALAQNEVYITACEKNKIRLDRLKYNLEKQGAKSVTVMQEDARKLSDFFSFDKILLDAPCSGSGTENVYKEKFTQELIQRSSKTQKELLLKASKILKKGGEIVYSTCSILKQENEDIIKNILNTKKFEIVPVELPKEIETLPVEIDGTKCVLPNELFEGFFIAKLRKI